MESVLIKDNIETLKPHIFYINLEKRTDRLKEINEEFNIMGIQTHERFNAICTPGFGILGCTLSHLEVFKLAKERGYSDILIFEDDFKFLIGKDEFEQELQQIYYWKKTQSKIITRPAFDVIMFAYNLKKIDDVIYTENDPPPFLQRVLFAHTASCYLVEGHYLDTLIELYTKSAPLLETTKRHWEYSNDVVWKELMERDKWYITKKRVGLQRPSFSDNCNQFVNHGC
jgi:GR25 family glycosyltransferase involved in LPS biosynthesis